MNRYNKYNSEEQIIRKKNKIKINNVKYEEKNLIYYLNFLKYNWFDLLDTK